MTSHYDIQYLYIQTGAMEREGLCGGARRREKGWQNIYDVWSDEKRVVVVVVGASLFRAGASLFLSIRPVAFHFYVRVRNQENGSHWWRESNIGPPDGRLSFSRPMAPLTQPLSHGHWSPSTLFRCEFLSFFHLSFLSHRLDLFSRYHIII